MATGNIFDRLQKHALRLTEEGSKTSAAFVHGWNDALYISLSIGGLPGAAGDWCPPGYVNGWTSCRALLQAIREGHEVGHTMVGGAVARLAQAASG